MGMLLKYLPNVLMQALFLQSERITVIFFYFLLQAILYENNVLRLFLYVAYNITLQQRTLALFF